MDNSGLIYMFGVLAAFVVVAYVLGLRDSANAKKNLILKLKKNWGDSPKRKYKEDDFDHISGYYDNHREGFQIDDTTWNDLNMDGVFTRMNYCLSASGEEYLYYMLRTPKQTDDFENEEKKIQFFSENDDARLKYQLIFGKIEEETDIQSMIILKSSMALGILAIQSIILCWFCLLQRLLFLL